VVSPTHSYLGVVSADSLRTALQGHVGALGLAHAYLPGVQPIIEDEPVSELIGRVAQASHAIPVVAPGGHFRGAISKNTLLRFLDRDTPPIEPAATAEAANATTL